MTAVDKNTPPQAPSFVSPEDELLKRSTDCVYFLASPLTCKRGSECEYRHSEAARNNPSDCRFWLNGMCGYDVGCAYRHPPLDGLMPPQAGNYAGPLHSSGPAFYATQNAAKAAIPCYYFQMGSCTKGSRCTYLHGPIPSPYSKIKSVPATTTETPAFKKTFGVPEKNQQTKMNFHSNASQVIEIPRQPQGNATPKVVEAVKHNPHRVVAAPLAGNNSWKSKGEHSHRASSVDDQTHQNGRDADDSLRESSPGFDVLVDDKISDDEYYHNEDQYGRMRSHEGRRSSELGMADSVADVDHDVYRSKRRYDAYDDLQDQYARKQRGASYERQLAHDRRVPYKPESPGFIHNSSDLRHRLSKPQRGNNGLRSVVNRDHKPNYHPEDREYRNSRRDTRSPIRESSIGGRFEGRLKLPRGSSPVSRGNVYSERDRHGERYRGRSSPSRPRLSSHQGRLHDRLGGRVSEESREGRNFRGQMRKDSTFQANGNAFAGPRRLSEIRGNERTDNKHQQLTGQQSASDDISFDGPKPLSEILKRKRSASGTAATGDVNLSSSANNGGALSSSPEQTYGDAQKNNQALTDEGIEEETGNSNKKVKLIEDDSSLLDDEKPPEVEDGLYGGDTEVDEVVNQGDGEAPKVDQEFDQGDGEYDYEEEDDVEGYSLNERDAVDNEGFMDEDEGDDFAKKLGVSL